MSKYYKAEDVDLVCIKNFANGDVLNAIRSLPTIDIVHCKECSHCLDEEIEETMPIYIYCDLWKGETEWDGFCKYGERINND